MLSEAELHELWDGLDHEAFRLETLSAYAVPHEAELVDRYLTGAPHRETDFARDWADYVAQMTAKGVTYHRVHVVHSPLSPYERYECEWGYTRYTQRGERAYILDTAEVARPAAVPEYDFWLLDDRHVIRMHYDGDGGFVGAELLPPTAAEYHRRARDAALAAAVPFEQWWPAHPQFHRENWLAA
jgi:hypothetical protein